MSTIRSLDTEVGWTEVEGTNIDGQILYNF